jgi:membrane protease YdiL (CAAX protease family)
LKAVPLAVIAAVAAAAAGSLMLAGSERQPSLKGLLATFLLMHAAVVLALVFAAATGGCGPVRRRLGLHGPPASGLGRAVPRSFATAAAFFPVGLAISAVAAMALHALLDIVPQPSPLLDYLDPRHPGLALAAVFGILVLAPVAEELFFRLALHDFLASLGAPAPGAWVALGFAVVHGQPYGAPALFLLSLVLQHNRRVTGSMYGPILTHAAYNLLVLLTHLLIASL